MRDITTNFGCTWECNNRLAQICQMNVQRAFQHFGSVAIGSKHIAVLANSMLLLQQTFGCFLVGGISVSFSYSQFYDCLILKELCFWVFFSVNNHVFTTKT